MIILLNLENPVYNYHQLTTTLGRAFILSDAVTILVTSRKLGSAL